MALHLNLVTVSETLDDIEDKRKIKLSDILIEQRVHFNRLVDALGLINTELTGLKTLSEKVNKNEEKLDNLIDKVIPEIKLRIDRSVSLMEAKLNLRIEQLEKEKLLENAHSRRRHLIANGIAMKKYPRGQSEPTERIFRELMVNQLKLDPDYVKQMLFRDVHRLPKSNKFEGPPPIIAAFICQQHRNDVLSAARELAGTNISLKSDLPRQLNELRGLMLKTKYRLKNACRVRLVERTYLPVLQKYNETTEKWDNIMEFKKDLPLQVALKPTLPGNLIEVINLEPLAGGGT
jgi:hypothetical protein